METAVERRQRLYGTERSLSTKQIRNTLTKSHVLQDGEYNFTTSKLKDGVWQTSSQRDFPGTELDRAFVLSGVSQLDHHFHLGNDEGTQLPAETYQGSTTKDDFDTKAYSKPTVMGADRTVNWPDMASRYNLPQDIAQSEYKNTFMMANKYSSTPLYPKVNTCKMKLPLDPERFYLQKNSHFKFGNDQPSHLSEHQRMFGRSKQDGLSGKVANSADAIKLRERMKRLDVTSNVFREGDYNSKAHTYMTSNVGDYGPRTRPPAEILASEIHQEQLRKEKGEETSRGKLLKNTPNHLVSYARSHTVPIVFRDALNERQYQTAAHFKFGCDEASSSSIYDKDFAPGARAARAPPKFYEPPSAGHLLQCDPDFSKFGTTVNQTDFTFNTPLQPVSANGKTDMENNIERRHGDNVILTYDHTRHTNDRQNSLSHGDYKPPPRSFKAMKPVKAPTVQFDYLQTNDALPYEGLPELSEAKNNFTGSFMEGFHAMERRRQKEKQCWERVETGKGTHFTLGYARPDFVSETTNQFEGRQKNDGSVPAAGKSEVIPKTRFGHTNVSENTMDMNAANPYETSSKEALAIRYQFEEPKTEHAFRYSVMKSDFGPLGGRSLNAHQRRMLDKYDTLCRKDIEQSHFFHTDSTGRNNYLSTTMNDFEKPENMTGQKLLAAR